MAGGRTDSLAGPATGVSWRPISRGGAFAGGLSGGASVIRREWKAGPGPGVHPAAKVEHVVAGAGQRPCGDAAAVAAPADGHDGPVARELWQAVGQLREWNVNGPTDMTCLPFRLLSDVDDDHASFSESVGRAVSVDRRRSAKQAHVQAFVARSTTAARRRRTSAATGAISSLPTIESMRSASTAEMCVSPPRS